MKNNPDYYYIPTGIDKTIADYIINTLVEIDDDNLTDGKVSSDLENEEGSCIKKLRDSKIHWIHPNHWVSGVMTHCILEANQKFFNYDLLSWTDHIQYTKYDGKGSHYSWHCDTQTKGILSNGCETRKLSISLLLSDPDEYEGGEFQIMHLGDRKMTTMKPPIGHAIIFPSTSRHRVRPIRSGVRRSLVGWYGGPDFR